MTHLVDVRLVAGRDGRIRLSVDGRPLLVAADVASALRFVLGHLERVEPERQMDALASAICGEVRP